MTPFEIAWNVALTKGKNLRVIDLTVVVDGPFNPMTPPLKLILASVEWDEVSPNHLSLVDKVEDLEIEDWRTTKTLIGQLKVSEIEYRRALGRVYKDGGW